MFEKDPPLIIFTLYFFILYNTKVDNLSKGQYVFAMRANNHAISCTVRDARLKIFVARRRQD